MSVNEQMVQDVVKEVMAKLQLSSEPSAKLGVFHDMNDGSQRLRKHKFMFTECRWIKENISSPTSVKKHMRMQKY